MSSENFCRLFLKGLATLFAVLGIGILSSPDATLTPYFSQALGPGELPVAEGYVLLSIFLAWSAQSDLRYRRHRLLLLAVLQGTFAVSHAVPWLSTENAPGLHFVTFLVHGAIAFCVFCIWRVIPSLHAAASPFAGCTVIVTGAASGLGRALAEELAGEGAYIYLADRDIAQCTSVAGYIRQRGGEAEAVQVDVTRAEDVRKLIEDCVEQRGGLDYMFNNAGVALTGQLRDCEVKDLERVLRINLNGVVYGTHAALRAMLPLGCGHIINTASVSGLSYQPGGAIYCASKYGVVGFTQAVRAEVAELGIKVSMIVPGALKTAFWDNMQTVRVPRSEAQRVRAFGQNPQAAARIILRGVTRNKATIFTPVWYGWLMRLSRPFPESDEWTARRMATSMHRHRLD